MTLLTGENVMKARGLIIASALSVYARTGMKVNRAYTPTAMLKIASEITGKKYKRGEYMQASIDIKESISK